MLRAAKFRIYPTAAQEAFLWAQWGAVRKCWNMALFLKKHYYRTRCVSLDLIHEIKPLIARAKKSKKYAWLREYDSMALQESVRNLNKGYRAFFEGRAGFPHYKSRRGPQSLSLHQRLRRPQLRARAENGADQGSDSSGGRRQGEEHHA